MSALSASTDDHDAVVAYDLVIPTVNRASLRPLLQRLLDSDSPGRRGLYVVDDRKAPAPLALPTGVRVLSCGGRGPAAARNLGWRSGTAPWVVFLDDDVLVDPEWSEGLARDLARASASTGAVQGRITVPRASGRRSTDWERNVAALEHARWVTADIAYRRQALLEVGGFDERFPRAFREDADLALRVQRRGYLLHLGDRVVAHPVRPVDRWVSVRLQRGNADDVLMRRVHGRGWRQAIGAPGASRFAAHVATVVAGVATVCGAVARQRRLTALAGAGWLALTAEFAAHRILPGPKTRAEVGTMLLTSVAIPPAAVYYRLLGWLRRSPMASDPRGPSTGP